MTLDELKKDKQVLEEKIRNLIFDFQEKYNVYIKDIEFSNITSTDINGDIFYRSVITKIIINL